jgi:polyisoprenoid-binding protein YceI
MKQIAISLMLALSLPSSSLMEQHSQNINLNQLHWTGKAAFNTYSLSGTINVEQVVSKIGLNTIEELLIVVDMTSLNHENSDLTTHLQSKDFFEVSKFETAVFTLSQPAKIINGKATIKGLLSIKGISKEESFTVAVINNELVLDIVINRINYKITYNSPSIFEKLKDQAIADEFRISGKISLE